MAEKKRKETPPARRQGRSGSSRRALLGVASVPNVARRLGFRIGGWPRSLELGGTRAARFARSVLRQVERTLGSLPERIGLLSRSELGRLERRVRTLEKKVGDLASQGPQRRGPLAAEVKAGSPAARTASRPGGTAT
ncbi:MAG: hypothetical protein KatS3mg076_2784 [Candidatus Binatia bacterium]|nr:MAG: hypothetical protein KatS3mg076_2784 [Candidatus Binatia bacterium]